MIELHFTAGSGELPSKQLLVEMLRRMLRIRFFDEKAASCKAAGIPGFLHNSIGQEAEIVGACMALRKDDYMTGNHRSHGHPIGKGAPLGPLMAELFGKKTGICRGKGGSMHLAAFGVGSLGESGIVGASMPAAVGAALSARLRGTDQVCLSFFGDGAANCGPFHESLNLAAIWKLPVVFLCENNRYAGCTPQAQTTAVADVACRAAAYAIPGVTVDGQNVIEVYDAVTRAVARARAGSGPTLVEAKTYRYCDHLEDAEEFPTYRSAQEVAAWRERDPIGVVTGRLQSAYALTGEELQNLRDEVAMEVDEALHFARHSSPPSADSLTEDVFV
jgi:acetoin:2,6-dichlorophenolindophenol oxidoreductase subunit alpha